MKNFPTDLLQHPCDCGSRRASRRRVDERSAPDGASVLCWKRADRQLLRPDLKFATLGPLPDPEMPMRGNVEPLIPSCVESSRGDKRCLIYNNRRRSPNSSISK